MLLSLDVKISVSIIQVLKFQSISHELLFSNSMVFCLVLVFMEYLIYLKMLPKKTFIL